VTVADAAIFVLGACAGAAIAAALILRLRPAPAVHVTPEAIQRAIAASGGVAVHFSPNIIVDWSVIHRTVEGAGYQLVAKDEAGTARTH